MKKKEKQATKKEDRQGKKRTMAARLLAIVLAGTMIISSLIYIFILIGDK